MSTAAGVAPCTAVAAAATCGCDGCLLRPLRRGGAGLFSVFFGVRANGLSYPCT
jgi:hypothetical protein